MSTAAPVLAPDDDGVRITEALRVEQLRLYDANLLSSVTGSLLVAALLVAVQPHPAPAETLTDPLPPAAATLALVGVSEYVQGAAA